MVHLVCELIISGGEYVKSPNGEIGINFRQFPEFAALERWKHHNFLEVERDFAHDWRQNLLDININSMVELARNSLAPETNFSSIEDIKAYVDNIIKSKYNQFIHLAIPILNIPEKFKKPILERWHQTRPMSFEQFAPYASFVLKVNLFFYLSIGKKFISPNHKKKPTNIIDLSYLYYLPFGMIFSSSDSFHIRIAPLFMDREQMFIPGEEFKTDLKKIVEYYRKLPDEIKEKSVFAFAPNPPIEEITLVGKVYDKYMKGWRKNAKKFGEIWEPSEEIKDLPKQLNAIQKEQTPYLGPPVSSDEAKHITVSRLVPIKRGEWWILPKNIEEKK